MTAGVDLWLAPLDLSPACQEAMAELLSEDERARAGRFRFERDRHRFVAARAILRGLLGHYLNQDPRRIVFAYGPGGKPELPPLHFNLAHSDDHALYAIAPMPVGVDLERRDPDLDPDPLIDQICAPPEAVRLRRLAGPERRRYFYQLWTRKEACCKATGVGILNALRALDVSAPSPIRWPEEPHTALFVADLEIHPEFAAAFAVVDRPATSALRRLNEGDFNVWPEPTAGAFLASRQ